MKQSTKDLISTLAYLVAFILLVSTILYQIERIEVYKRDINILKEELIECKALKGEA